MSTGSACGTKLCADAEQFRSNLVSLSNLPEGDALVVANAPQGTCPEAYVSADGVAPACGDVAVIDAGVFAPGRDGVVGYLQLSLRKGVAPDGREREVVTEEPLSFNSRRDRGAGAQRDARHIEAFGSLCKVGHAERTSVRLGAGDQPEAGTPAGSFLREDVSIVQKPLSSGGGWEGGYALPSQYLVCDVVGQVCADHTDAGSHEHIVHPMCVVLYAQHLRPCGCGISADADPGTDVTVFAAENRGAHEGQRCVHGRETA